jgi:hypothetical protein
MTATLAPVSRAPLAEVSGPALLLASKFCERGLAQTENLVITPGDQEGSVSLFALSATQAIALVCDGECQRRIEIPGASLSLLRQRHADADHVAILPAVGDTDLPALSVRSFSEAMTMSLQVPEGNGGLTQEDVEKVLGALKAESEPRSTTTVSRLLLGQTLALLKGQATVRIEQRQRGLVLHVRADTFAGQVLVAGIFPEG